MYPLTSVFFPPSRLLTHNKFPFPRLTTDVDYRLLHAHELSLLMMMHCTFTLLNKENSESCLKRQFHLLQVDTRHSRKVFCF